MNIKECKNCKIEFFPNGNQVHCSIECRTKFFRKLEKEQKTKRASKARISNLKTCNYCGDGFMSRFYGTDRQKFCSKQCKSDFHKEKKLDLLKVKADLSPRKCQYCNETFTTEFNTNHQRQVFCSSECKKEFHKEQSKIKTKELRDKTFKVCPICDNNFTPSNSMKQIYCTRKCANSIQKRVYNMMRHCYLKTNTSKSEHANEVLGYSPSDLLKHLETFSQWNELKNQKWHLDHKFPIIAFVRNGITDISLICRLDNLQPLPGTDNCKKNDIYNVAKFEYWLKNKSMIFNQVAI